MLYSVFRNLKTSISSDTCRMPTVSRAIGCRHDSNWGKQVKPHSNNSISSAYRASRSVRLFRLEGIYQWFAQICQAPISVTYTMRIRCSRAGTIRPRTALPASHESYTRTVVAQQRAFSRIKSVLIWASTISVGLRRYLIHIARAQLKFYLLSTSADPDLHSLAWISL